MDDTISRQAAIDAVLDMNAEHRVSWKDAVIDIIAELPAAQPDLPRWIPCAERKPTRNDHKDGVVLACYDNGQIRFNACMDGRWVLEEPIAWMPLPEPYEEEQDEQGAG